jgi:hypothetical protein
MQPSGEKILCAHQFRYMNGSGDEQLNMTGCYFVSSGARLYTSSERTMSSSPR